MGDPKGFMSHPREEIDHRSIRERIQDYTEVDVFLSPEAIVRQASRCMDCGIPFCQGSGCYLDNRIPEWNDMAFRGRWKAASINLHSTNNFPEFTGRVCPAPCEASCTLNVNDQPVLIRHIECQIVEKAFEEGWIQPLKATRNTGKSVAVVGSGPSGLACAQQLARQGHHVVVFEKDEKIGGLLRYGIPDFKLDKYILDRRLKQMREEGVEFRPGVEVGRDISGRYLLRMFDATCLTIGAGQPRDIVVEGRDGQGIHMAMAFLSQQNRRVSLERVEESEIVATGHHVVVIGGGDTGSDCVGTSIRQGAASVTQLEILPRPPEDIDPVNPWPLWPKVMRTSSSQEEGCERMWGAATREFVRNAEGTLTHLRGAKVEWKQVDGRWCCEAVPGSEFVLQADMVILAMGFVHPVHEGIVTDMGLELTSAGTICVDSSFCTSHPRVFAAGDAVLGASLVMKAIKQGRQLAEAIHGSLEGSDSSRK